MNSLGGSDRIEKWCEGRNAKEVRKRWGMNEREIFMGR
jgi:hypothetical protein